MTDLSPVAKKKLELVAKGAVESGIIQDDKEVYKRFEEGNVKVRRH